VAVAITTETYSRFTARVRICIRMAVVADGVTVIVPTPMEAPVESRLMRLWIIPFDAVRVYVARRAGRVISIRIMATRTALNIFARICSVTSAPGTSTEPDEIIAAVPDGYKFAVLYSVTRMTLCTEGSLIVAGHTVALPPLCIKGVCESIVQPMDFLHYEALRIVIAGSLWCCWCAEIRRQLSILDYNGRVMTLLTEII
jgi:hypothetical protein